MSYRNPNILVKLQNRVKTNTVLNQTEGLFEDFTRKSFGNQVIQMYEEYKEAVDKNLKIDLINLSSFSIYEVSSKKSDLEISLPILTLLDGCFS